MNLKFFMCVTLLASSSAAFGQGQVSRAIHHASDTVDAGAEFALVSYDNVDPMIYGSSSCDSCCDSACDAAPCHSDGWMSAMKSRLGTCRVYGAIDALYWHRTNGNKSVPLIVDADSGSQIVSTSDFGFSYESGYRATIGVGHVGMCCLPAVEMTFLGIYDWSDSVGARGDNSLSLAGDLGSVVNGFTLAEGIGARYKSELNSFETNYFGCILESCCCDCYRRMDWLVGFRYLSLDENLGILGLNENVAAAAYRIDANNDLYGMQIGSRYRGTKGCLGVEVLGKLGLFGNDASQRQSIVDELGTNNVVLRNASSSGGQTAYSAEFGVSGIAKLTGCCGIRAGYNLLWLGGLALAPDQLDFTDTPASGVALSRGGNVFMHGFNVGLEYGW